VFRRTTVTCNDSLRGLTPLLGSSLWPVGLHGVVASLSRKRVRRVRYPYRSPFFLNILL